MALPAGTRSTPFWSLIGPAKTFSLPEAMSRSAACSSAAVSFYTRGPIGAILITPSATPPK
jgi:hypothetical protein